MSPIAERRYEIAHTRGSVSDSPGIVEALAAETAVARFGDGRTDV